MNPLPPPQPSPSKRKSQLQGPRPPHLKVSKDSHQIRKPPPHPQQIHHNQQQQQQQIEPQQPVIIYDVSPKVIHTTVNDFSSLVQRLTGPSLTNSGDLSPAARLASIEKTSPSERERERVGANTNSNMTDDFMEGINFEGVGMGYLPGILSPAPVNLPPIQSGYFSPVSDMQSFPVSNELSPFWLGSNSFMASPSALLSAPVISPSPSSFDVFYNLFDF